jgi:pyruvate/2-oxoglutarate/acetoin dehydrogenase E1 component
VVAPSTPADSYALLRASLECDGPVIFVDHKRLFPIPGDVPVEPIILPFGKAAVLREGSDLTLTTHSYMTRVANEAATALAKEGVSVEVIDLRSLAPLDIDTVAASVARTGRLLTLEEGQPTCGVGAEVVVQVQGKLGPIPFARVGALPAPVSSNPVLEPICVPDAARVCDAVRQLLSVG